MEMCKNSPSWMRSLHLDPCGVRGPGSCSGVRHVCVYVGVASILMSLRVDKLYERKVLWSSKLQDPDSEQHQQLAWEAARAVSTTPVAS
ncbi:hypothetical protein PR048_007433 [Dryococelus australis]|uniref:ATP synthase subunit e, mitochondrial n=1 Tax=Dryococelus australis TaxID=614101 RepID=A0ABQ9HV49_9NEOP|nr:hypothetical protein PR048_007433 [Dryococelus australis]